MDTPSSFELERARGAYVLSDKEHDHCRGEDHKRDVTYYIQDDGDGLYPTERSNHESSLVWDRRVGCAGCVAEYLPILGHGGHYHNVRFYRRTKAGFVRWDLEPGSPAADFKAKPLEPDAPYFEEESEPESD